MAVPGDFQFRNPEAEKTLNDIGNILREVMPPGHGFVLLIASYGEGGGLFYSSNIERRDVCNMMREFIQKAEPQ